jgi:hypothetical protein
LRRSFETGEAANTPRAPSATGYYSSARNFAPFTFWRYPTLRYKPMPTGAAQMRLFPEPTWVGRVAREVCDILGSKGYSVLVQRRSASSNPSVLFTSPAQAMQASGRISNEGRVSTAPQRILCVLAETSREALVRLRK